MSPRMKCQSDEMSRLYTAVVFVVYGALVVRHCSRLVRSVKDDMGRRRCRLYTTAKFLGATAMRAEPGSLLKYTPLNVCTYKTRDLSRMHRAW